MRWLPHLLVITLLAVVGCGGGKDEKDSGSKDKEKKSASASNNSSSSSSKSSSNGTASKATTGTAGSGAKFLPTKYMPSDTIAAVAIKPSTLFAKIPAELRDMTGENLDEIEGFKVAEMKRATLFVSSNVESFPTIVVEMTSPVDMKAKMKENGIEKIEEIDINGKKAYRADIEAQMRLEEERFRKEFDKKLDKKEEVKEFEKAAEEFKEKNPPKDDCQDDKKDTAPDKRFDKDDFDKGFDKDFDKGGPGRGRRGPPPMPFAYSEGNICVIGTKEHLTEILSAAPKAAPVASILGSIDGDHEFIAAGVLDPIRQMIDPMIQQIPPAVPIPNIPQKVKALDGGVLTADLGDGKSWNLTLKMKSADGAADVKKTLDDLKNLGVSLYSVQKVKIAEEMPASMRQSSMAMADKFIQNLTISSAANDVTVSLKFPEGFEKYVTDSSIEVRKVQADLERNSIFRQIGISLHQYHDTYLSFTTKHKPFLDKDGKPLLSWRVHILPYIEQSPLYDKFKLNEPWDSEHNKKLIAEMPPLFKTTDDPTKTTIMTFTSKDGNLTAGDQGASFRHLQDGMSQTILAVEAAPENAVIWTKPQELEFDPAKPVAELGRPGEDFVIVLFADGAVFRVPKAKLTDDVLKQLIHRADNKPTEDLDLGIRRRR